MKSWVLFAGWGMCLIASAVAQTVEFVCPLLPKPRGSDTCSSWCPSHPSECDATRCTVLDQPGDDPDDYERSGCTEGKMRCCETPCGGTKCAAPARSGCYIYNWRCYGGQASKPETFPRTSARGPMAYVDGQSTTAGFAGHVRQWEYNARITGVPVIFYIFMLYDGTAENELRLYHQFTHTARETGLQEIIMDMDLPANARIGFEVKGSSQVPIKYRIGKPLDGSHYTSFMGYRMEGNKYVWNMPSINRQYVFRICFDTQRNTDVCPVVITTTTPTPPPTTSWTAPPTPPPVITTTPSECVEEQRDIGCFGQGVPRHDGTHVTSSRPRGYSAIDLDGSAQLPGGIVTKVEYRVWKLKPFTFQLWRPEGISGILTGRMQLIFKLDINPDVTQEVQEIKLLSVRVNAKDRIGWTYTGSGSPPIKYNITRNVPNNENYYNWECEGCANNVAVGQTVTFPVRTVQKQYRIRVCMAQTTNKCPPGPPTPSPPDCENPRMGYKQAACYGHHQPGGAGMMQNSMKYFYIDTESKLSTGFLTEIRFLPTNSEPFYFQVWRRDTSHSSRLMLVYSTRVQVVFVNQENKVDLRQSPFEVKDGDMFGFKYMGTSREVPIRYDVANNVVGGAYNTYECSGNCAPEQNVEVGGMLTIPGRRGRKRFRIGACISTYEKVCGPVNPIVNCPPTCPPGPPGPPGVIIRGRRDVNALDQVPADTDESSEDTPPERINSEDTSPFFDTKIYNVIVLTWIGVLSLLALAYPIWACASFKRKQEAVPYSDLKKAQM